MPPRKRKRFLGQVGHEPHVVYYGERVNKAGELQKGGRIYLWWLEGPRGGRGWKRRSLGFTVRDSNGEVDETRAGKAKHEAEIRYARLTGKLLDAPASEVCTLAQTWPLLIDEGSGKYPFETPYRKELEGALKYARKLLGDDFAWVSFDHATLQKLVRARALEIMATNDEAVGFRAAEVLGTRLLTIMTVLRDREQRIPSAQNIPGGRTWREELQKFIEQKRGVEMPDPERPRYTHAEILRILAKAWEVDPRLGFATALGAEYRGGQVVRGRRTHLDVAAKTFTIIGRGKKRGTVVHLTDGQMTAVQRALTGYLAPLEQQYQAKGIAEYPLFPGGMLHGMIRKDDGREEALHTVDDHATREPPVKRTWIKWWIEAEKLANVDHVPGRGWYGGRRILLDVAVEDEQVQDEVMQEIGGWANTRTPQDIYRNKTRTKAREEAARVRAKVRGEPDPISHVGPDLDPDPRSPEPPQPPRSTDATT